MGRKERGLSLSWPDSTKLMLMVQHLNKLPSKLLLCSLFLPYKKNHKKSRAKEHVSCLGRRMQMWLNGEIEDLLEEGRTIQNRSFRPGRPPGETAKLTDDARSFAKCMFEGKCNAALKKLSEGASTRVLHEDDSLPSGESVIEALKGKHPPAQGISPQALFVPDPMPPAVHPVVFECLDADLIRDAAKHTQGAAGPSGIDAHGWRRICCAFKSASNDICHSLALLARRICTQHVHPSGLSPVLACRLISTQEYSQLTLVKSGG